jgi:hypothetical protein
MIRTRSLIDGARLFRITSVGTGELFTVRASPVVLEVQRGKNTTLSDDAAGEWIKKTGFLLPSGRLLP